MNSHALPTSIQSLKQVQDAILELQTQRSALISEYNIINKAISVAESHLQQVSAEHANLLTLLEHEEKSMVDVAGGGNLLG